MDQTDNLQNLKTGLKTLSQFSRYQFVKKITQLLLSVSVFSLLLSNSSRLSFLHPFNFYFSSVPLQLFSHTIDKNCIFLLCNGLLVFVAKFSGLISSSSSSSSSSSKNSYNNNNETIKNNYEEEYDQAASPSLVILDPVVALLDKEDNVNGENEYVTDQEIVGHNKAHPEEEFIAEDELNQERENGLSTTNKDGKESEVFVEEDDQKEEIKEFDDKFPVLDELEEEYEDEENGMLSTEELNKKFEEFIRKMKEEIRIEAQQQLVMVN